MIAVSSIDRFLKEKVRGDTLGLRRINVAEFVGEEEARGGRGVVDVANRHANLLRRLHIEKNRQLASKPQVFRPLADVEGRASLRVFPASLE